MVIVASMGEKSSIPNCLPNPEIVCKASKHPEQITTVSADFLPLVGNPNSYKNSSVEPWFTHAKCSPSVTNFILKFKCLTSLMGFKDEKVILPLKLESCSGIPLFVSLYYVASLSAVNWLDIKSITAP